MDFLTAQPDVTILTGDYKFGQTFGNLPYGASRRLGNLLKESSVEFLPEKWVLIADADEFLIFPPPVRNISEFINALSHKNQPYATAPMVDMYPQCLAMRNYPHTVDPFEASTFFDTGPYYDWSSDKVAPKVHHAGIRHRLLKMLAQKCPSELLAIHGDYRVAAPTAYKVPLLKHGVGIRRIGDHAIAIGTSTANAVAFAHFKFSPVLDGKIATAIEEGQYHQGSLEYKWLALAMAKLPFESLISPETRQYAGPDSIVAANLFSTLD